MENEKTSKRRILQGKVVSNKMDKTVVVEVERRVLHPRYKRFMKKNARYHAHDENNEYELNDVVQIQESRPLSKLKRWNVIKRLS